MKKTLTFLFFISICIVYIHAQGNGKVKQGSSILTSVVCSEDIYEPNNTPEEAVSINPIDNYLALICSPKDIDWYLIEVPRNTDNLKILMSDCQRDYDMELYDMDLQFVAGSYDKGGTNEKINLHNPKVGNYYLKIFGHQNDYDASATYALRYYLNPIHIAVANNQVLRTQFTDIKQDIKIYPNPVVNTLKLNYHATTEGILTIIIYDHVGRIMNKLSEMHGEGSNTHNLDVSYLPDGFYMMEVIINNERQLKKITIAKK
jgi:hypothetical protein